MPKQPGANILIACNWNLLCAAARRVLRCLCLAPLFLLASSVLAEDRSMDGSGNNLNAAFPEAGMAGAKLIRPSGQMDYPDDTNGMPTGDVMLTAPDRANPRTISNAVSAQSGNQFNTRNLSDYAWAWGQFLDHDVSISEQSMAAGMAFIPVTNPSDPLFTPMGIPFVRSGFELAPNNIPGVGTVMQREQVNNITAYIDASNVYGSDDARAAALRTNGGTGAKLHAGANALLPENTLGMHNDNGPGTTPANELFLAGDIRVNENVGLTSLHTIFHREHNRLVDIIQTQQPSLDDEQTYQLARKIVGAQMQKITYDEFLPALFGDRAPRATDFSYDDSGESTIANSFAHAAYRFGHSMLASQLQLVADDGSSMGQIELSDAFFNPDYIKDDPTRIDLLLKGLATQKSQEIDTLVVDDVRNLLFGPAGSGGMDLAALNIQRGRDHGLPSYNALRASFGQQPAGTDNDFGAVASFAEITSDPILQQALEDLYGDVDNIDPWVGGLAEDHLPGSSVGELMTAIIVDQFVRLRDHDRLFYLNADAGLYTQVGDEFVLNDDIASIIDLDHMTLADLLMLNSGVTSLQANVFFAVPEPSAFALALGCLFVAPWRRRRT